MARFYLIDHSLIGLGGHHYEYALHVLRAAERFGYEIVLGCHRRFRERRRLPGHWHVLPVFPHHMYGANSLSSPCCGEPSAEGRQTVRLVVPGLEPIPQPKNPLTLPSPPQQGRGSWGRLFWKRCADRWRVHIERRRTEGFARGFRRIFLRLPPSMGDIVFLPTLSDFDYHTLAEYLRSDPQTELPDWHLQFHFAFLEGRPAEYTRQQDRVESMRRRFESALQAAPNHRLHFYSTTQEMVDQFRRASPANFELLPYPVNPSYRGHDPDQRLAGPLRITCAGAVREEKGQQQVVTVLRTLWEQYFARQKLQLLVQSKKSRFRAALYREGLPATSIGRWPLPCGSPIVDVPHPLTTDAYAKLLAASDLALFLYDSRRYYARCAGILVEMLAAGVPVVVPAGCWLGEQIAEAVYSHLDGLRAELDELGRIDIAGRLSGSMSASRRTWNPNDGHFDSQSPIAHVEIPAGARHLMVRLRWAGRVEQGTVARLDVRQYSATGQVLDSAATSLGQRTSGHSVPGCVHVAPGAARVEMLLCNAFGEQPLPLERATAVFLSGRRTGEATCPLGAVGLIAADTTQVPRLVRDIVNHHNHYVRTAREFSRSWADTHEPEEIVRQLRRRSQAEPRCDAAAVPGHGFHRVRSVNSVLR